ncbi:hypothetical protein D3C76_1573210 [compost metagenome]
MEAVGLNVVVRFWPCQRTNAKELSPSYRNDSVNAGAHAEQLPDPEQRNNRPQQNDVFGEFIVKVIAAENLPSLFIDSIKIRQGIFAVDIVF